MKKKVELVLSTADTGNEGQTRAEIEATLKKIRAANAVASREAMRDRPIDVNKDSSGRIYSESRKRRLSAHLAIDSGFVALDHTDDCYDDLPDDE